MNHQRDPVIQDTLSDLYIHKWNRSALVQVMAWHRADRRQAIARTNADLLQLGPNKITPIIEKILFCSKSAFDDSA